MIEGNSKRGVFDKRRANNFGERRRKVGQSELAGAILRGQGFGERFAEGDAERPDVGCGKERGLRRSEWCGNAPAGSRFSDRKNAVGGEFYVVADSVDVGGFESAMNETALLEKIERWENRG